MSGDHGFFGAARLRRAVTHFLIGKGLTAPLTIVGLVLLVRAMPIADYGLYVTAFAVIDIGLAATDFGLSWLAWRFVPAYRVAAGQEAMRRFVLGILLARTLTLVFGSITLLLLAPQLAAFLGLQGYEAAMRVAAIVFLVDGLGRFIREVLFESLLLQGRMQSSQLIRNLVLVGLLGGWILLGKGELPAREAMLIELISAGVALLLSLVLLWPALRAGDRQPAADWVPPNTARLWRLAWPNYLSVLWSYVTGPQAIVALASRVAGPDGAAVLGMARNFVEQVRKYLPSELFVGVARPAIIAAYETEKHFATLNRYAQALYKTSFVTLVPVMAVAAGLGGAWIDRITAGKYEDAHVIFFALLCTLVPIIHRRVLEMVVNIVDCADLWLKASIVGSLALPLGYALLVLSGELVSLVLAVLVSEIITNVVIIRGLIGRGYHYRMAVLRPMLALSGSVALGLIVWAFTGKPVNMVAMIGWSAALVLASLAMAWGCRVFDASELAMLKAFRRPKISAGVSA